MCLGFQNWDKNQVKKFGFSMKKVNSRYSVVAIDLCLSFIGLLTGLFKHYVFISLSPSLPFLQIRFRLFAVIEKNSSLKKQTLRKIFE